MVTTTNNLSQIPDSGLCSNIVITLYIFLFCWSKNLYLFPGLHFCCATRALAGPFPKSNWSLRSRCALKCHRQTRLRTRARSPDFLPVGYFKSSRRTTRGLEPRIPDQILKKDKIPNSITMKYALANIFFPSVEITKNHSTLLKKYTYTF